MKQKVVVIGNSFTSRLAVIRALANMGCEITVVCIGFYPELCRGVMPPTPADCYSQYVSRYLFFERKEGREGLVRLLLNECADPKGQVLLIPTSDFSVVAIDTNQHLLEKNFVFPHIRHEEGAIERWMNKELQKKLAREVGLTTPDSIVLKAINNIYQIPDGIHFPCFTKPLASIGGGKQCQRRCNTQEELHDVVNKAKQLGITELLVENFIRIGTEYAVLGWSNGKDVIIPSVLSFIEGSKAHKGIAMLGKVMPITGFESLLMQFKSLIQSIGYVGIFDIDFYESDGKSFFCELNLRFGGSGYAVTKMGVNLPAMYVQLWENEGINKNQVDKIDGSAIYVNERMCLDDWNAGYISTRKFFEYLKTADIRFISDKVDLNPEKEFKRICRKRMVINTIKRIIRK